MNAMQSFALPCSELAKTVIIHILNVGKLQMKPLDVAMHAMLVMRLKRNHPKKRQNVLQICATRFTTHALKLIPRIQVIAAKEQMQRLTVVTIALSVLQIWNLPNQDTIIVSTIFATTFIFTALTWIVLRTNAESCPIAPPSVATCVLTATVGCELAFEIASR